MQWAQAAERADQLTNDAVGGRVRYPADSWDGRAIRGVLTVVLAALARRQQRPAASIDAGSLLWHLDRGPAHVYGLGQELHLTAEEAEPQAAAEWAWLTRCWPTDPPRANSDGMPRGIGRGSQLPAVEVCTLWAATVTRDALVAERPAGLQPGTRIEVTGGEHDGATGEVLGPAWFLDNENQTVRPGPPPGYEVRLQAPGTPEGPQRTVLAPPLEDVVVIAPRPAGARVIVPAERLAPADRNRPQ